jgi:multidrug efflux system outer membrane protein
MIPRSRLRAGLIGLAALALAGCTLAPKPMTDAERRFEAAEDLAVMFGPRQPLRRPLTIEEAYARGLKYNLDTRVKVMEEAIARDDFDLSRYDLLPRVVANAGYTTRSNVEASSSRSVLTGRQSLEPSTSSDINRVSTDLTASWNLLDFGVSYFNARQQADRTLVAEEARRRSVHILFQDIRRAFWQAASAQALQAQVQSSIRAADAALRSSRNVESEALRSPVDALRYQRSLLELLRQLELVQRYLATAKVELASLVGLPPGSQFTVAVPGIHTLGVERIGLRVADLERTALLRNPDIREQSYQRRITVDETHKAIVRLMPGLDLSGGPRFDSNSFLVNNYWSAAAVRASWNIVNLLSLPTQLRRGEHAEALSDARRQAVSMAVLAKLHIAYRQYQISVAEYRSSRRLADVDRRLYQQISNRVETDAQGELEKVSAQVSAVTSDLRVYQSYAELQAALGRLYAAMGVDPVPAEINSVEVDDLTVLIRKASQEQKKFLVSVQPDVDPPAAERALPPSPEPPDAAASPAPAGSGDLAAVAPPADRLTEVQ